MVLAPLVPREPEKEFQIKTMVSSPTTTVVSSLHHLHKRQIFLGGQNEANQK